MNDKTDKTDRKHLMRILSRLTLLTQVGLTFITPPLLLLCGAVWLQDRFGTGDWVVIAALLVGLLSGGCGVYGLLAGELRRERRDEAKDPEIGKEHGSGNGDENGKGTNGT